MPRVLLLSFDAEALPARRRSFEESGFTVAAEEPSWPKALEIARKFKPDVIAVDCEKLPSHARETAEGLRKAPETRDAPVVLFRVAEHDVERTRLKVPGGVVAYEYEIIDRLKSAALTRIANEAAAESAARAAVLARPKPAAHVEPPRPAAAHPRAARPHPAVRKAAPRKATRKSPVARKKKSAGRAKAPAPRKAAPRAKKK